MLTKRFSSDIDIDFGDREQVLKLIQHVPATIMRESGPVQHNTGIYVTDIPVDPFLGSASLDYRVAEERGYIKLDMLNVGIYSQVTSEEHLIELMNREPPWDLLLEREFCGQLIHIGNHYDTLMKMPEPVDSIPRMAMFLSVIRPAKRHLIGLPWREVGESVWTADAEGEYQFKRSHAVAYAHLVVVHMNLLTDSLN